MTNIILLGAPASGKGTQAEILSKKLKLYLFQTGDLARKLAEKDERLRKILSSGKLVPEEEMAMYVVDYLARKRPRLKNILFEGFPRFVNQYQALSEFLKTMGDDIDAVISLDVSEKAAIERISGRRICSSCKETYNLVTNPPKNPGICDRCGGKLIQREDDKPDAVRVRFKYYEDNTKELIDYLSRHKKLIRINGEGSIEEITGEILKKLQHVKKN